MLEKLSVVAKASAMARHAAARHRLVAENVANADTPGYRARDLRPFGEMVNATEVNDPFTPRATREGHLLGRAAEATARFRPEEIAAPPAPNGNSVNLEEQTVRSVEIQGDHALALAVYRKAADIWRIGLGRNR